MNKPLSQSPFWHTLRRMAQERIITAAEAEFQEPTKKRVGGNLSSHSVFVRVAMLQRNAWFLRGGAWLPPQDDGTLVRKVVGLTRKARD